MTLVAVKIVRPQGGAIIVVAGQSDPYSWESHIHENERRLVIILNYATAVFLAAKAQSTIQGLTNQIIFGAIYLGPAVILHLLINRFWGEEKSGTSSE